MTKKTYVLFSRDKRKLGLTKKQKKEEKNKQRKLSPLLLERHGSHKDNIKIVIILSVRM